MDLQKEKLLIEESKHNPNTFGKLFDVYYEQIYLYCLKRVGDVSTAQDITSETFIKSFQSINKFTWQNISISAWFYKIATNEIRMYFRKSKYCAASLNQLIESEGFEPISEQDLHQEAVDAQTIVERQADFIKVQKILTMLPLKYQEVISLRFIEKKKLSEIALILGKKEGTVKSILSRGLVKLRVELEASKTQPYADDGIVSSEGQIIIQPRRTYEE